MLIDKLVTSGKFRLDGGEWDVDNNVYVVGDDQRHACWVIDPAHDPQAIVDLVGGRKVRGVILTHGHSDHVDRAPEVAELLGAPMYLHPDDDVLWQQSNPGVEYRELLEGDVFPVGEAEGEHLRVIHTPGHTPGCVVLYAPAAQTLLSGDTLFAGGPGATGRKYSNFDTIIESLQAQVMTLPEQTRVLPGHGDETTVGAEKARMPEYIERGY